MNAAPSSSRMGGRAPRRTATRPAATPAAPHTDAAQSRNVAVTVGSGHENHQGGPAGGRGVDTTALPGPAAEMMRKMVIATAMAAAENQPSRRVRRPADGGWGGGAGGRGTRVSRLPSCSFIGHAPWRELTAGLPARPGDGPDQGAGGSRSRPGGCEPMSSLPADIKLESQ